jgi:hypothetical protein
VLEGSRPTSSVAGHSPPQDRCVGAPPGRVVRSSHSLFTGGLQRSQTIHGHSLNSYLGKRTAIMNEYEPTNPHGTLPTRTVSSTTSMPSVAASPDNANGAPAPPPESSPDRSGSVATVKQGRRPRLWRLPSNRKTGRIVAAVVMAPVIALSVGLATSPSASAAQPVSGGGGAGSHGSGGGGSNARS